MRLSKCISSVLLLDILWSYVVLISFIENLQRDEHGVLDGNEFL